MLFGQSGCDCCPPSVLEHNCGSSALPIKWWSAHEGASKSVAMVKVKNKSGKMRPKSGAPFCFREQHLLCWKPKITSNSPTQTIKQIFDSPGKPCRFTSQTTPIHAKTETFFEGGKREETLADWNELFKKPLFGLLPLRSGHVLTLKFYQGFSSPNCVLFSASTRASTANFSASPPPKIRTHDDFIIDVIWCDVRGK